LRLDYQSGEQFLDYYEKHRQEIRRVYDRYLGDNPRALAEESDEIVSPGLKRHLERMDHEYSISFDDEEIELHARLAESLDDENPAVVEAQLQEGGDWLVTIVAYDYLGELSLICGLLFVHQLDIIDVDVFTYESAVQVQDSSPAVKRVRPKPGRNAPPPRAVAKSKEESRKKIVDVFLVRPNQPLTPETWFHYQQELRDLLKLLQAGRQTEATGALAKRVAAQLRVTPARDRTLYPVDIEIDNTRSEQFTLMSISAPDTIGFLYELANALAMNGVNIARVHFKSLGGHAYDLLYVTDQQGRKITDERDLQELRAATVLTKQFTHLLPNSPNPEAALTHFREFMAQFFGQPDWMESFLRWSVPKSWGRWQNFWESAIFSGAISANAARESLPRVAECRGSGDPQEQRGTPTGIGGGTSRCRTGRTENRGSEFLERSLHVPDGHATYPGAHPGIRTVFLRVERWCGSRRGGGLPSRD
jgi:glutamate-ammonia-ligase adenylyltransferase